MKLFGHWGNFITLSLVILGVYSPALFTFFAQDDFIHLIISRVGNIRELINFFNFKTTGIYYRPVSVQLITFVAKAVFGLRPFWFHLTALGFHLGATLVVKKIIDKLTGNKPLGWWAAVFYGVHPMHFMSVYWWAEVSMVMAPLFAFLAIWEWLNQKHIRFSIWFLLALLSNELAISVVPIAWLLRREWRKLILAGLMGVAVVGGRWLVAPPPLGTEYGMKFLPQIALNNLRWQVIRAVGLPEGFGGQLALDATKLAVMFIGLSLLMLLAAAMRTGRLGTRFWMGSLWFGLALVPVLFLEHHQSPIYGIIGLPGFFLMISGWLEDQPRRWIMAWAILFVMGGVFGIRAMEQYHWVTRRAREAEYYIEKLKNKPVKDGDAVVFMSKTPESSLRAYIALGAGKGVNVWFGDEVEVFFEDVTGIPNFGPGTKAHYLIANWYKI